PQILVLFYIPTVSVDIFQGISHLALAELWIAPQQNYIRGELCLIVIVVVLYQHIRVVILMNSGPRDDEWNANGHKLEDFHAERFVAEMRIRAFWFDSKIRVSHYRSEERRELQSHLHFFG